MQNEISYGVHTEKVCQFIGIKHVSLGFAHFSVSLQQPGMTEDLFGQRQIQSHQEDGPVDGVEADDILTNQMQVSRPVFLKEVGTVSVAVVADTGDIVGQGIQPYVGYMLRIEGYGDTPGERGTGYAEILQTWKQEVIHHFVFTGYRLDEFRMGINVIDQSVGVFAHFEEICLFFCRCHRSAAVRTFSVHQLRFCKEGFAGSAVQTLVISFINVSLIIQFFENLLYLSLMISICGADEFIIRGVHQIPDPFDFSGYFIHKFLWCDAFFRSF